MDVFLVYILLLVFFLGLIPVLWLVLQERGPETSEKSAHMEQKQQVSMNATTADKTASYGLLGVILAFMLILTILIRREQS